MIQSTLSTDSPWRRLPWTLPSAILIWAVALWGLAYFVGKSAQQQLEPPPIEARFIEQSVPAVKQNVKVAQHKSKPLPLPKPQPAPTTQQENLHAGENPQNIITAAPGTSSPGAFTVPGGVTSANRDTQTGSGYGKSKSGGNMYANGGARAIVKPMPQIPDELREGAFNFAALARFHIAADGSAEVELARPTPNPRLNRILLDSLKKWRFMPAIKNGKPVATTEEIVIKIEVH